MNDVSATREYFWQTSDLKLSGVVAEKGETIEERQARQLYPTVFTHRVTSGQETVHRDLIAANTYSAKNCVYPVCPRSWIIPSVDRRTSLAIVRSFSFLAEPSRPRKTGRSERERERERESNSFLPSSSVAFLACLSAFTLLETFLLRFFLCTVVSSFWSLILSSFHLPSFPRIFAKCREMNVHERYV